jgi:hypothetical protein
MTFQNRFLDKSDFGYGLFRLKITDKPPGGTKFAA